MATYTPAASKFLARGFAEIVPGTFARELPEGAIRICVDADGSLLLAVPVPAGEPVPQAARLRLTASSQFTSLLTMLGVPV